MALVQVLQTSFAAGELAPSLHGRIDLAKYKVGLAKARNVFVDYRGGISNRGGTRTVNRSISQVYVSRLIPFQYSNIQSYALEFSQFKMRVIMNGGYVLEPAKTMSYSGGAYTCIAHGYSTGDEVSVADQVLPIIVTVTGVDSFTLADFYGNPVVSTATSVARVYTLTTPWAASDLALLKFSQSFDTITFTHPSYPAYDMTRTQHWVWTLTQVSLGSNLVAPSGVGLVSTGTGTVGFSYEVTAVSSSGDESVASTQTSISTLNITATAGTITASWSPVFGATKYNIYRAVPTPGTTVPIGAQHGYLGTTTATSFTDGNIVPDFTKTPPLHTNIFAGGNYPAVCCYFQQRRVFAGSNQNPQTLYFTQPGLYKNMDSSDPVNDGDALTLTINSTRANNIKSLVSMPGGLVVLTTDGAWQVSGGGQYSAVKASAAVASPQSFNGANDVPPISIGYEILYVQQKGSIVRNLAYNFYSNTYQTSDLTLLSSHFFAPRTITEWAYAEEPYKIVWAVMDDGRFLSFTYIKDQEVAAWCEHDTFGLVESMVSIQESNANVTYLAVWRPINGTWVRFIEQMMPRDVTLENSWFVDCGLDYALTSLGGALTLSGISGTVTGTASTEVFTVDMVGRVIRARGGIGTITSFISPTQVSIKLTSPVTDYLMSGDAIVIPPDLTWTCTKPITKLLGLDHLNGCTVSILADGNVLKSQVVSGGIVNLPRPCTRVIVGLPFTSQIKTLPPEPSGGSVQGHRKRVVSLTARVNYTRGLKFGPNFNELREVAERSTEGYDQPTGPQTRDEFLPLNQYYDDRGQTCIQQDYPLPMSLLMLASSLDVGDQ